MSDTVLVAETGRATGSAASRRLRGEDSIPGVVYGLGMEPLSVSVQRRELRTALSGTAGLNTILDLQVDGTTYPALVKDIQRHPVRHTVSHVDFIQVNLNAEITVSVPLRLVGTATEVVNNDGLVDPAVDHIEVVCTPRSIPDELVVDISAMTMDTVIRLADVALPDGVTATGDPEMPVVTVLVMRASELETDAVPAEEVEGEEGAEEAEGEGAAEGEAATPAEGAGAGASGSSGESGDNAGE
ncbi:MAG: 50S ribosomal protein L25 [Ilumatobacteraceae bacterium]